MEALTLGHLLVFPGTVPHIEKSSLVPSWNLRVMIENTPSDTFDSCTESVLTEVKITT